MALNSTATTVVGSIKRLKPSPQTKRNISYVERLITMTNIEELLKQAGIELPEDKKADFDKNFIANYKTVAEVEKLTSSRDNLKSQLETAQTALKDFEGVDVNELKGKITQLQTDLGAKETEYQGKIADMEFNSQLDTAIGSFGARNAKSVMALLDIDSLKTSKNQAEDIKNALETVKTDNDYLFTSSEPIKNAVKDTGQTTIADGGLSSLRSAMGLKD